MPEITANAGVFFEDKYGVMAAYVYNWDINKHAVGAAFLYKF